MRKAEREAVALQTLAFATTPCEAIVFSSAHALTRFTQNAIHQNLASDDTTVRVRVVTRSGTGDAIKTGVAETNDLCAQSLRATVARALTIASFAPDDTTAAPLGSHATATAPPDAFDDVTATAPPAYRAELVARVLAPIEAAGQWAAGYAMTASDGITIANTQGTLVSFDGTSAAVNVKSNAADSTGYAEHFSSDAGSLDGTALGTIASAKATQGAAPVAVDPGDWTVILEPAAFGELLSYLTDHFSAQSVDEGSSFLCDGLDRPYAHANVTLTDDYSHPLHAGMPFDYEGYPRQRVTLIERGVARGFVTDAAWATKLARPNTGHGLPAPSAEGPRPLHLVVASGEKTVEELIAQTPRGLLVSRFWYIRPVDQRKTIVTGMTRDGTFLIEDGRVTRGVRNMRFNQSILGALANVELARTPYRTGGYSYSLVTPAAKIAAFRFSSVTAF
jgi:predicted Zn-dependent protease